MAPSIELVLGERFTLPDKSRKMNNYDHFNLKLRTVRNDGPH
jgi:hypothetical protein